MLTKAARSSARQGQALCLRHLMAGFLATSEQIHGGLSYLTQSWPCG